MKNSRKYSPLIKNLFKTLKKKHGKVTKKTFEDPIDAIVYAVTGEYIKATSVNSAVNKLYKHFIDLNDLRVSRVEEIAEVLELKEKCGEKVGQNLKEVLGAIYNKFDSISLLSLKEMGKRQAKKELEKIKPLSSFALNYCIFTSLDGHAVPLTERMVEYLKDNDLVNPEAKDDDIEGFLQRQISASQDYEFYRLLRKESETTRRKKAVKKTTKKKTVKKKAAKKKTKKKKTKTKKIKKG